MKKFGLLIIVLTSISIAQPWNYNLGTNPSSSYTTSNTFSTTFLPNALSGTSRVRVSNAQGGGFYLDNPGLSGFGSDAELRIVAPTGGSVNKFSIYDYTGSPLFTLRFNIRFGASDGSSTDATSGTWYLFAGDGANYSDNNGFTGAQAFTGLRFVFGASGTITTNIRVGNAWTATGITGTPFSQGVNYTVDIYGNNGLMTESYNYGGFQTVAINTVDIWVNGVMVANDFGKAQLPDNNNIDSWMFYGESSTGNVANIFLDDFFYSNELSNEPLPVELTSFSAATIGSTVKLSWNTATEINNYGFEIERASLSASPLPVWEKIGFVNGNGNSNSPKDYSFVDDNVTAGKPAYRTGRYSYRLKQIDNDGQFEYSKTIEVDMNGVKKFELSQNYPNPFNPATTISFNLPEAGNVKLTLFDILGQEIKTLVNEFKESGVHTINFNASELNSGMYIYKIESNGLTQTRKMTLIK